MIVLHRKYIIGPLSLDYSTLKNERKQRQQKTYFWFWEYCGWQHSEEKANNIYLLYSLWDVHKTLIVHTYTVVVLLMMSLM